MTTGDRITDLMFHLLFLIIVVVVVSLPFVFFAVMDRNAECEARGGVPTRAGCLDPDALR